MRVNSHTSGGTRAGAATFLLLVTLPALMIAMIIVLNSGVALFARAESGRGADAACLATIQTLVDDDFLLNSRLRHLQRIEAARQEGQTFLTMNPTQGRGARLDFGNRINDAGEDIVFGYRDHHRSGFRPAGLFASSENLQNINSVRIRVRQTSARGQSIRLFGGNVTGRKSMDMSVSAQAILARDVIGFRPLFESQAIPLIPIALRSGAAAGSSWEEQIERHHRRDQWVRNRGSRRFEHHEAGDGLPEMTVILGPKIEKQNDWGSLHSGYLPNASVLYFGVNDDDSIARQIRVGVYRGDLRDRFGGEFVLDAAHRQRVPGQPAGEALSPSLAARIRDSLRAVQRSHAVRIFPLYSSIQRESKTIHVSGFVAARVVEVKQQMNRSRIVFVIQPTQISHSAIVLSSTRLSRKGRSRINNRYLCKIRLVK